MDCKGRKKQEGRISLCVLHTVGCEGGTVGRKTKPHHHLADARGGCRNIENETVIMEE
jgi:hypothetical protein